MDGPLLFALPDRPRVVRHGLFAAVAIEQGVDKLLTYEVPAALQTSVQIGQRVRVPLGRKDKGAFGYVVELSDTTELEVTKPLVTIVDDRVLAGPAMMRLAAWLSRYYVTPLGLVLESMIPAAVKKRTGLSRVRVVEPAMPRAELQQLAETTKAKKRRAVLARLLQLNEGVSIELNRLAGEAGVGAGVLLRMARLGLLKVRAERRNATHPTADFDARAVVWPTLTDEQQTVYDDLKSTPPGFGVHLLRGVTGSGKTEIYLRLIRDALGAQQGGAIVLVPEIALTPQTVRRFTERFGRVAVLHSGLSAGERHRQWERIASGQADVVVGARSAVFAPLPKLALVVVDEEHESSYKQDTAPRYHARDVAIKRAHLENARVVLGSATPSLESWHNAQTGKATLHTLARRVHDRPLPLVTTVDLKHAQRGRRGIHLFGEKLERALHAALARDEQAILLLNRRGYSNFIYCGSCNEAVHCKYCDATMTFHRSLGVAPLDQTTAGQQHAGQMQCHYCLASDPLPAVCPTCGSKLSLFGLGTQRVEEEMARKFPNVEYARVDSDTMRAAGDYERLLKRFADGEVKVLLGTQMLAKGLDFPNVTLVGIVNGDTALSLPDYRAAERTFQLLTQVSGRAGRGSKPGQVMLQTFLPDDATIKAAVSQDYVAFAEAELERRREVGKPPFAREARIVLRDQDAGKLAERGEALAVELIGAIEKLKAPVELSGPMPCPIAKIAGYERTQVLLTCATAGPIQAVLARLRGLARLISNDRVAIDVDPVSLL